MKIEKIVKLKSGKYRLFLDNYEEIITYDNVILNHNLLFHKEIDDDTYMKILSENGYYELLNSSIKYISKRLRCEKEIRIYLEKKTLDSYLIDSIIDELKHQNLINDRVFTKAYINDKLNLTNSGILKIKNELINFGIDETIIEEEINKIDNKLDNNKLERIIIKKIKSNHKYSNSILKKKVLNDLLNLGYDKENIIKIFNKYITDDNDIYVKEYNKLYNKLKGKYSGYELESKITQKLYLKGFKKN